MDLVESLIKEGWLKSPKIIDAFKEIKRVDFLPEDLRDSAELNTALPIGFGQTISQPLVVAFMIEQLDPKEGDKVLDIGSGSGWTTALLSHIVGSKGKVIAIELVPELKEFGEKNVSKYNFIDKGIAEFICADGSKGYKKEQPYNNILASASAQRLPMAWKEELKVGGRIVTPIGSSIWVFIKKSPSVAPSSAKATDGKKAMEGKEDNFEEIEYPGFAFVPLIGS